MNDDEILHLARELSHRVGTSTVLISTSKGQGYDYSHHALSRVVKAKKGDEDGYIYPAELALLKRFKGGTVLRVHLWTRWYGEGYERGGLDSILLVADTLKGLCPSIESIVYGNDSDDTDQHELLDPEVRASFWQRWLSVGRHPYVADWHYGSGPAPVCPSCKTKMIINGGMSAFCESCDHEECRDRDSPSNPWREKARGDRDTRTGPENAEEAIERVVKAFGPEAAAVALDKVLSTINPRRLRLNGSVGEPQ
jgi:hypothetical protein